MYFCSNSATLGFAAIRLCEINQRSKLSFADRLTVRKYVKEEGEISQPLMTLPLSFGASGVLEIELEEFATHVRTNIVCCNSPSLLTGLR